MMGRFPARTMTTSTMTALMMRMRIRMAIRAMPMRLRKVLMMFSNRGCCGFDGFFFAAKSCVPFVMVILALKVLLMTDSEHVKVTRCCDFWLWTKMMCRFTADDA